MSADRTALFVAAYAENAILGHGYLEPGMGVLTKLLPLDVLAAPINDLIAAG